MTVVGAGGTLKVCELVSFLNIIMTCQQQMTSISYDTSNGSLSIAKIPMPTLREGEVMIKVLELEEGLKRSANYLYLLGDWSWCEQDGPDSSGG